MKARIIENSSRQELDRMRRWYKLLCAALNQSFGFGAQRLDRLMDEINLLSDEKKDDPVFWEHVDTLLIDQVGMAFDRENYKEVDQ